MVTDRKKKWTILTQYYPPEVGAPQIRLSSMVRELKRYGVDVEVLTGLPNYPAGKIFPEYQDGSHRREEIAGVPVRRTWIYAATGKSVTKRLLNYFSFTFSSLFAVLFGPRPDVLFVESQPLSLGMVGLAMKWLRGVPYIYNVPDLQIEVAKQMGFIRSKSFLAVALWMENLFLKQSWKVSTVTHKFIEHFVGRGVPREQVTFLPNGADSTFLHPMPPDAEMLERWNLQGKKVFLYVGTHAFYHGLHTLIEAAAQLGDRNDIAFLMIGDGPERKRIIQMAADLKLDNVVFGQSPYNEMDRLYSIAYASVVTLRNIEVAKSMRLSKMFPSLSCAVPVIYSGEGESAELIAERQVGIVVAPECSDLLAEQILLLADNQALRTELGQNGRKLVEEQYAWSAIVQRWLVELGIQPAAAVEAGQPAGQAS
jgi:glycosyltransferase involved in cell wall biosynthesis